MSGQKWMVYSREHNRWWRTNGAGYTVDMAQAGRYSKDEADTICRRACGGRGGHRDDSDEGPPEFSVLAPEALDVPAAYVAAAKGLAEAGNKIYKELSEARWIIAKYEENRVPSDREWAEGGDSRPTRLERIDTALALFAQQGGG